ncbi:MAG: hypothetical protein HC836_25855 [Richelia sp. RM2_1_2]|nr:hypothetical protein [Richelia sp. RM2_1_2]
MNNKFLQNKYAKWYFNIIKHRCQNIPKGYVEQHHVLPKSIGGDECDSNLVMLTAKEHYICHLLLIKAIASKEDRHKMYCAAFLMGYRIKEARKGKIPACLYEKIKQEMIENMAVKKRGKTFEEIYGKEKGSELRKRKSIQNSGKNNPMYGRASRPGNQNPMYGRHHSDETKKKFSKERKGKPNLKLRGRIMSNETRKKLSIAKTKPDTLVYYWIHIIYGLEICTRTELSLKYQELQLSIEDLRRVAKGYKRNLHHKGWRVLWVN